MSTQIYGTAGDDVLVADKTRNWVHSGAGNDTITFHEEGGTAFGGMGNDVFHLSPPGTAQVHAYGGLGDDTFYIDTAARVAPYGVHVWGGEGADKFVFKNLGASTAKMTGRIDDFDPSRDEIWVDDQRIDLQHPPDNVRLVAHQDQPWVLIDDRVLYALEGARSMNNDPTSSAEEVHFIHWPDQWKNGVPASADISFEDFVSYFPKAEIAGSEANLQHIRGTSSGETLSGGDAAEYLHGDDGDDVLHGNGGNDVIDGGERNDKIYGGAGNDSLSGGLDQDVIYGGTGDDRAYGGSGHDILHGESGNDRLHGNSGHDLVFGGTGNDQLFGGSGNDVLLGGQGSDTLQGGAGNDLLLADGSAPGDQGSSGRNMLDGGSGNDTLVGAAGQTSEMTGGSGADQFLAVEDGEVIIKDFNLNEDRLDLRGLVDPKADLAKLIQKVDRADTSGISDLRLTLPGGGSALLEGLGGLSADELNAVVLRDGPPRDIQAEVEAQQARIEGTPDLSGATEHRGGSHEASPDIDPPSYIPPDDTRNQSQDAASHGGGGCFVATASFGDVAHPDVTWLRQFRDTKLVYSPSGRAFIRLYWRIGPVMARYVRADRVSGRISRCLLGYLVQGLKRLG